MTYSTYNGMPVATVKVRAEVTFEAYIVVPDGGIAANTEQIEDRIASALADAIEFRAPYGVDTEPDDTLIALVGGGSGGAVSITGHVDPVDLRPDPEDVRLAAESTTAQT